MMERFQQWGGFVGLPDRPETLSVESLRDALLLLHVGLDGDDDQLTEAGSRHFATARRFLVRGDGSTFEEIAFDPGTGGCLTPGSRRGARGDSCWSQGLAYALHGFARAGRLMNFQPWLATAQACAHYLMEKTSGDPVPRWDLDARGDDQPRDSTAAAIAAAGLLELADAEQSVGAEEARRRRYWQEAALRILERLCQPDCFTADGGEGLLKGGVYDLPARVAVGESLIWGDFFLLEGLQKAIRWLRAGSRGLA